MRTLVLALALILTSPLAASAHCTTYSTSDPEVTIPRDDGSAWIYIDNDVCQIACLFSVWVYEESNGIPGLQRGDEVVDDTCHGMIEPDGFSGW